LITEELVDDFPPQGNTPGYRDGCLTTRWLALLYQSVTECAP
jgi:hypothetical protein